MKKNTALQPEHISGFRVSGQNMDIGEAIRQRITERVEEAINKYYPGHVTGHVTLHKEGAGFVTECILHLSSGITLHARGTAGDAYQSADEAALNLEKRLRRYKQRLKDRHQSQRHTQMERADAASYVLTPDFKEGAEPAIEDHPVIVAETKTEVKKMSVSEAVMELDLSGLPVLVFNHSGHGRVNVVFRREDGHIGWIDPAQGLA
ncbi:MAG: ribosome-associated translation inhibitor RaiA [Pseudomonadota bacterium]